MWGGRPSEAAAELVDRVFLTRRNSFENTFSGGSSGWEGGSWKVPKLVRVLIAAGVRGAGDTAPTHTCPGVGEEEEWGGVRKEHLAL